MIELGEFALSSVADVHIAANTPAYLYKNLRRLGAIQQLADGFTADDLVSHAVDLAQERDIAHLGLCEIYATLVAATLRPWSELSHALSQYGLPNVRWAREIASLGRNQIPTIIGPLAHAEIRRPTLIVPGDAGNRSEPVSTVSTVSSTSTFRIDE